MIFEVRRPERIVAKPQALQRAGAQVLGHHVALLHHFEEVALPLLALKVQRDAPLVGVEDDEVVAVGARYVRAAAAARVA